MKITSLALLGTIASCSAFVPSTYAPAGFALRAASTDLESMSTRELNKKVKETFPEMNFIKRRTLSKSKMIEILSAPTIAAGGKVDWSVEKGAKTFGLALDKSPIEVPSFTTPFPKAVEAFPGALTNQELISMIGSTLSKYGYNPDNTLVACSLCCDEVNRPLESDLSSVYTQNFNMGGLAGFPFGGAVAFGAMAAHIPDGGSTLMVYGPHVGVDTTGAVGTVERRGRANGGSCCGSAVAASGYVAGVLKGGEKATMPDDVIDVQQYFVGKALLPYADQLEKADDKMVELPYALYGAQSDMVKSIVTNGAAAVGDGNIAVLGGIQINTPPGYSDYYMPLSFDLYNNKGEVVKALWK